MPSGVDVDTHFSGIPPHLDGMSMKDDVNLVKGGNSKAEGRHRGEAEEMKCSDEGVEVVLNEQGATKVVDNNGPDQNVFRHPQAVRPRPMRAPTSGPPHPPPPMPHPPHPHYPYTHHGSGSWGYGPPYPHPDAYRGHMPPHPIHPHAPYPTPYPTGSNSFDDHGPYHHHTPHYSPHIQYPGPRFHGPGEVNVISPNHKGDPHYRPPTTPRPRTAGPYYHYPPTSPVSRPGQGGAPRLRNYAIRRGHEGASERSNHQEYGDDGHWNAYGPPHPPPPPTNSSNRGAKSGRPQPPIVAESFDSAPQSRASSSQTTPTSNANTGNPTPAPQSSDPHMQFYGGGGSWGSFDSAAGPHPYPDDQHRYYGLPPDSPYSSSYGAPPPPMYTSPGALYHADSFPSPHPNYGPPPMPPTFSYSYDDEDRLLQDYHPDHDGDHNYVTPPGASSKKNRSKNATPVSSNISGRNSLLPKAAEEVDFDVVDPPLEPVVPESDTEPSCDSLAEVNTYDVLCGRGGGTNSQIGNRRFRQLVQEFQPIYLMAKRKEKPLLARTIVLIIRKRGGRFLKKNEETGELFEVGDLKAEAKTSQALREGLDVRATKSSSNPSSKKGDNKKLKSPSGADSPKSMQEEHDSPVARPTESPPPLPRLQGEELHAGTVHPHSPESSAIRKRRRIRSSERFVSDFMPPRADINNRGEDDEGENDNDKQDNTDDGEDDINLTPIRRNGTRDEEDYPDCGTGITGCAGIALDIVTGAAKESFCFGPTGWSR
jgi:hypothetical protein